MSLILSAFDTSLGPIMSRAWSQQDREGCEIAIKLFHDFRSWPRCRFSAASFYFRARFLGSSDRVCSTALGLNDPGAGSSIQYGDRVCQYGPAHVRPIQTCHDEYSCHGCGVACRDCHDNSFLGDNRGGLAAATMFISDQRHSGVQVWRLYHVQPYTMDLAKPVAAGHVATGIILMLSLSAVSF